MDALKRDSDGLWQRRHS